MRKGGAVSRAAMNLPAESLLESNGIEPMKTSSERNASVIVPIREVTYQLKSISYQSAMYLIRVVYKQYMRTSVDKAFSLIDHISSHSRQLLLNDMRVKKYHPLAGKIDEDNVMDVASDDLVVLMLMEYLRPKSPGEYEERMYGAVTRFPKTEVLFGPDDYDVHFAPWTLKIVSDVLIIDTYARHGIRDEDVKHLPLVGWGERGDGERGVIQIAMQCLTPYAKNFEAMIKAKHGAKRLIHTTSLEIWKEMVTEVSDDLTRMAISRRQAMLRVKPLEKAEAVHARVEVQRMQKGFIEGKAEKKKVAAEPNLGRIEAQSWEDQQAEYGQGWHQGQHVPHQHGPQLYGVDWQNPVHEDRGPQPVRNFQGAPRGSYGGGRDGGRGRGLAMRGGYGRGVTGGRVVSGRGRGPAPPAAQLPRPPKEFTVEAPYVCFKYALHDSCDKGDACPYSHDAGLAEQYITKMIRLYKSSKHFKHTAGNKDSQPQLRQFEVTSLDIIEEEWYGYQAWEREHGADLGDGDGEGDFDEGGELNEGEEDPVVEHGAQWRS